MDLFAPSPRRPRPVAGVPAIDGREAAKAWLLELVASASLEAAAALPAAELAHEGPGLAEAIVAALRDDEALARLAPGGDLAERARRAGALAGGADPVAAVEALRRAIASSIHAAVRLDAATAAELGDRLAHVCSVVASAAASGTEAAARSSATVPRAEAPAQQFTPAPAAGDQAPSEEPPFETPASPAAGTASPPTVVPQDPSAHRPERMPGVFTVLEPGDGDQAGEVLALRRVADPLEALRARQTRQAEPVSWRQAVEWRLKRHEQDDSPFALLAVEVDGVGRLLAAQEAGEVEEVLADLERSLAAELRPADQLLREDQGRYWVTAPDTGPAVARLLAERLAESARAAASHRGVPLRVSIGIASCPDDGADPEALADHADRALFAARAAGTSVA